MSFETQKLPGITIAELYKKNLVEMPGNEVAQEIELPFLGKNKQRILILVNYPLPEYIPPTDLQLLTGILIACKLSIDDIALLNMNNVSIKNHKELIRIFSPATVILFGLTPEAIELPVHFPNFQVQSYNRISFLSSPQLILLESDKLLKSKLWLCLKQIFQL